MTTRPTVDRATASREELVALVSGQPAGIGQVLQRIAELEQRPGGNGMAGVQPVSEQRAKATGKARQ